MATKVNLKYTDIKSKPSNKFINTIESRNSLNIDQINNATTNTKLDTTKPDMNKDTVYDITIVDSKNSKVSPHQKAASQRWKKISGVFHSLSNLRSHDTKNIDNECEIDNDLQDYQIRLLPHTAHLTAKGKSSGVDAFEREMKYIHGALSSPHNNELFKSELFDIIIQGKDNKEAIKKIEMILELCQHDKVQNKKNPEYFLNKHFNSGKNLFYLACQEGKIEIVKLFISKGLDAKIFSKVDEVGTESPLECACRWGYVKIVELLLAKVYYSIKEIENCLKIYGLSKKVILTLKNSIKDKSRKEKVFCFC